MMQEDQSDIGVAELTIFDIMIERTLCLNVNEMDVAVATQCLLNSIIEDKRRISSFREREDVLVNSCGKQLYFLCNNYSEMLLTDLVKAFDSVLSLLIQIFKCGDLCRYVSLKSLKKVFSALVLSSRLALIMGIEDIHSFEEKINVTISAILYCSSTLLVIRLVFEMMIWSEHLPDESLEQLSLSILDEITVNIHKLNTNYCLIDLLETIDDFLQTHANKKRHEGKWYEAVKSFLLSCVDAFGINVTDIIIQEEFKHVYEIIFHSI